MDIPKGKRTSHMEYMEGMEVLADSHVMDEILQTLATYDYDSCTAAHVRRALDKDTGDRKNSKPCFRLPQSRFWKKWPRKPMRRPESTLATAYISLPRFTFPITVKTTAYIAGLIVTTEFAEQNWMQPAWNARWPLSPKQAWRRS